MKRLILIIPMLAFAASMHAQANFSPVSDRPVAAVNRTYQGKPNYQPNKRVVTEEYYADGRGYDDGRAYYHHRHWRPFRRGYYDDRYYGYYRPRYRRYGYPAYDYGYSYGPGVSVGVPGFGVSVGL